MKYQQWLNEWLALYVKPTAKTRTYEKYQRQIERYILPTLGKYELTELAPPLLQHFTVDLSKKSLSANTINGLLSLLKSSLKRAVQIGVVDKEFSHAIVRPKGKEKQVECFSLEEQRKIERYIFDKNDQRYFGIILALYTGLRIGELLALTWKDIDFCKGLIIVSKSCHDSWQNGKFVKIIDTPKTDCSMRIIPLPKPLLSHLKTWKKNSKSDYIVCGRNEYGAEIRSYQNTFTLLLKRLNIPHKGFHSLRHPYVKHTTKIFSLHLNFLQVQFLFLLTFTQKCL